VDSIEEWRKQMGLERFHLLGHSLGGFLVGCYALRYPHCVDHLVLLIYAAVVVGVGVDSGVEMQLEEEL
jgi:pimeloyl-ACP methyl ester carboxylesterase